MDGEPSLSVSIMAHWSRAGWVDELRAILGPVPVAMDRGEAGRPGMLANGSAAWRLHDPAAEYHLVLQDDVILCEGFTSVVRTMLARLKHPQASSLYFGNRTKLQGMSADALRRGWCRVPLRWGPAICLPTRWIPSMLAAYEASQVQEYDRRVGDWLASIGQKCFHPVPSLVDHRQGDSLIGNGEGQRAAFRFAG